MEPTPFTRRSFLQAAAVAGAAVLVPATPRRAQADARPLTIPALREWNPAPGVFTFCAASRIVVAGPDADALGPTAATLSEDLRRLTGSSPAVVRGESPRAGDIALRLGANDDELGSEGYRLAVGDRVVIAANAVAGAFYGTRTLLQLLLQGASVPAGAARDWPRYPERGLLVDIGRQHFSFEWLAAHIEILSWLKLNYLHLHFTENLGWRIECESHPDVTSDQHLTKAQVRELIDLAAARHITVVPELGLPGHMGAALRNHPEFQLRDALGRANPNSLDYTLAPARQFVFELIDEYLDLFPGPYWHTGADEFLVTVPPFSTPVDYAFYPQLEAYARDQHGPGATAKDGILGLLNTVDDRVQASGKTLRVWNDGLAGGNIVTLDPDIIVEWWTDLDGPLPAELLAAGHRITNFSWFPTYYTNGFPGGNPPGWSNDIPFPNKPRAQDVYDGWEPHRFHGPLAYQGVTLTPPYEIGRDEPRNLGSKIGLWNDDPTVATEDESAAGIAPRLRSMAQKTWGTPLLAATYAEFEDIIDRVGGPSGRTAPTIACRVGAVRTNSSGPPASLPATGASVPFWPAAALLGSALALRTRTAPRRP